MKNIYPFVLIFAFSLQYYAGYSQAGMWTWMKGDSTSNSQGNYGTPGIPSPRNEPPGRYACGYWTDTAGNFWIYGGLGFDPSTGLSATKGDLWMFDPTNTNWTWMNGSDINNPVPVTSAKGVFNAQNQPGAIAWGPFTWVTPNNHLWLYGGGTTGSTQTSDLWQFAPEINQWAWMGNFGPANFGYRGYGDTTTSPGFRWEGNSAWVDSVGNLWFFGGWDHEFLSYNDVWMYNVPKGIWTWMSGTDIPVSPGLYALQDTPSVNSYPAARATNLFWNDDEGNLWLAGGYDSYSSIYYTDIWKFNSNTLQWTWSDGADTANENLSTGTTCEIKPGNEEGIRWENRGVWKICDDLIINYGGWNYEPSNDYNDLWGYLPSQKLWINLWTGSSIGNYGTKGVANPNNSPYPKNGAVGFKDRSSNLWLFGGSGNGFTNDLWMYVVDTACLGNFYCNTNCAVFLSNLSLDKDSICADDSAHICAPSGFASYQWNKGDTGKCIYGHETGDYFVTVTDNNGCTAESNHVSVLVYPPLAVSLSRKGDTLYSYNAVTYQWLKDGSPIKGAASSIYIAKEYGSYSVIITDTNGCTATSNPVSVTGIDNLSEVNVQIFPNPSTGTWQLTVDESLVGNKLQVYDAEGRLVFQSEIRSPKSAIIFNALPGVYLLQISSPQVNIMRKLVRL